MSIDDEALARLRIGDRITDNDPRMEGRVLTIIEIHDNGVVAEGFGGRKFRILRRRIHTDGKPRRSGFSRIVPCTGGPSNG